MVVSIEYEDHKEVVHTLRKFLRQGVAVLIRGWFPGTLVDFTVDDIMRYRPPIHQPVTWQGPLACLPQVPNNTALIPEPQMLLYEGIYFQSLHRIGISKMQYKRAISSNS